VAGMRRRANGRRRKTRGGNGKLVALGLAGAIGAGVIALRSGVGSAAVPLNTAPMVAGEENASSPAAGPRASGPVPAELASALTSPTTQLETLTSLRRIALEFSTTNEAERARQILARERARGIAANTESGSFAAVHRNLKSLTRAYVATLDPDARRSMRPSVLALSARFFNLNGTGENDLFSVYTVASGDVLSRIATKHGSDYRLIKGLNGLKNDRIRIGQRLRIPTAKVTILIFKQDFEILTFYGGCLLRALDCATGKDGKTPEGEFVIGTKLVNPDWYAPDGRVYRFGTKENVLGTRWLAFKNTAEHQGFGIHGTSFPESIGTEASMGCIRLRNADVQDLYDLVPPGSIVRVVR
jgi:LysM repeat protein